MAYADGVYKISSKIDDGFVFDVSGGSRSPMANIAGYMSNDSNSQKFLLSTSGAYKRLKALCSGMLADVDGGIAANGRNVWQYTGNGSTAQDWQMNELADTVTINGVTYYCVSFATRINTGYVIDLAGALTTNNSDIQIYASNASDAQKWVLHKDSYFDSSLPVPYGVGISKKATGTPSKSVSISAATTLYPSWYSTSRYFQVRYRSRGRYKTTNSWSAWGAWKGTGASQAENGWVDPWTYAVDDYDSASNLRNWSAGISVDIETATYDKKQYQIEVRAFNPTGNATYGATHGGSFTKTVDVCYLPTFAISSAVFTPDGLLLSYTSDFARDGNKLNLTVYSGATVYGRSSFTDLAQNGTVTIPISDMIVIPADNTAVTIYSKFETIDNVWVTNEEAETITYSANHGVTITPTITDGAGYTKNVSIGTGFAAASCHVAVSRGYSTRFYDCVETSAGVFNVVPPLGAAYTIFIAAYNADATWGTKAVSCAAVYANAALFNHSAGFAALAVDVKFSENLTRDSNSILTGGRASESTSFGIGSKRPISISGYALDLFGILGSARADFEELETCNYATFRMPTGEYYYVAVTDVSMDVERSGEISVQVSMKEQS